MKLNKVVIATKETKFEWLNNIYDDIHKVVSEKQLADIKTAHDAHYNSLTKLSTTLDKNSIQWDRVFMRYAGFDNFKYGDLFIALGGDGTVLKTAHYIRNEIPILPIRSDEQRSEGALCVGDAKDIETIIDDILNGHSHIEEWTRAEVSLNDEFLDLALNEVFVGPKYSVGMGKYILRFGDSEELQDSSGIVISTGCGSTGWMYNIDSHSHATLRTSKILSFWAREIKRSKEHSFCNDAIHCPQWQSGCLSADAYIELESRMDFNGIVTCDGDQDKRMHDFHRGDIVKVKKSDKPLRVVSTNSESAEYLAGTVK